VFKKLKLPKDILQQLTYTLNEVHQEKIEFYNKHFDSLTKKHKELKKMMDNLYEDKLKGRITESKHDRFYQKLRQDLEDVNSRLAKLEDAENNYYITTKYLLDLSNRAYDLFVSSEVEEKRQLINLVLSNLKIEGKKVFYDVNKPLDAIVNYQDGKLWRPISDYLRTFLLENFDLNLQNMQRVFLV